MAVSIWWDIRGGSHRSTIFTFTYLMRFVSFYCCLVLLLVLLVLLVPYPFLLHNWNWIVRRISDPFVHVYYPEEQMISRT